MNEKEKDLNNRLSDEDADAMRGKKDKLGKKANLDSYKFDGNKIISKHCFNCDEWKSPNEFQEMGGCLREEWIDGYSGGCIPCVDKVRYNMIYGGGDGF